MRSVAKAARLGCCPIERNIRRCSGANTIASTVAHKTALKKGQNPRERQRYGGDQQQKRTVFKAAHAALPGRFTLSEVDDAPSQAVHRKNWKSRSDVGKGVVAATTTQRALTFLTSGHPGNRVRLTPSENDEMLDDPLFWLLVLASSFGDCGGGG